MHEFTDIKRYACLKSERRDTKSERGNGDSSLLLPTEINIRGGWPL